VSAAKRPPKAAPDKGAAARAEVAGEKTFEYEGLKLTLPAEFPTEVLFDMVEVESANTFVDQMIVSLRILRSIVGQDQFIEIRNVLGRDVTKTLDLMERVLELYGLTMGESAASPES
jgi:hypothetical protein